MKTDAPSYHGYRFPPEIISHAVWLYHRFCVSFRNVEELLAQRGITVSYEAVRLWCINPNRKIFAARKRETAALGAGEKLVLGHPLAATIGDSARCMQNLEKVLFTGPKTSDTVTFICD